jgi:hypothetical protein
MTKTAMLLTLIALASPAHAQQRVFVSGHGLDTNPCSVTQPCRTFQHAHDIAAANSEIDVLDPAGYGQLNITKGISIQAHGFGGITAAGGDAINIIVTTSDPVLLNGLLIDGGGIGNFGIQINSAASVQILNSVVRHFQVGISDNTATNGSKLLIEDTIASDNMTVGIMLIPAAGSVIATLNRITLNNNFDGVATQGNDITIANSVLSNNSHIGLNCSMCVAWLAKTVILGSQLGVSVGGTVFSYGDNYIANNGTPLTGAPLTPVTTQ